jgi:hypothetical protein
MKHKIPVSHNSTYMGYGQHMTKLPNSDENELTMVLISGINSDGRSILFGWGFLKDPCIDSYSWFLDKFIQF